MQIKQKIFKSLNNGRLNPIEGEKKWYNYILNIQHLTQHRNNLDGFLIHVYDLEKYHLESVTIEIRPVTEFGCVHNKMFLRNI